DGPFSISGFRRATIGRVGVPISKIYWFFCGPPIRRRGTRRRCKRNEGARYSRRSRARRPSISGVFGPVSILSVPHYPYLWQVKFSNRCAMNGLDRRRGAYIHRSRRRWTGDVFLLYEEELCGLVAWNRARQHPLYLDASRTDAELGNAS